ncbi:MAG: hypothetical protein ACK4WC_09215 [Rubrimonas sp.]
MDGTAPNRTERERAEAADAAAHWLRAARAAVDAEFGEGYAAANPALLAALVQASAIESAVNSGRHASAEAMSLIARLSRETNETILKLKPRLFG